MLDTASTSAARAADRDRRRALKRHAAGQCDRDDGSRAAGPGVVARRRRGGEVNEAERNVRAIRGRLLSFLRAPHGARRCAKLSLHRRWHRAHQGRHASKRSARPWSCCRGCRRTVTIEHHADALIMPGFVDPHIHYPQTAGDRLLWRATARMAGEIHLRRGAEIRPIPRTPPARPNFSSTSWLRNGTTTAACLLQRRIRTRPDALFSSRPSPQRRHDRRQASWTATRRRAAALPPHTGRPRRSAGR